MVKCSRTFIFPDIQVDLLFSIVKIWKSNQNRFDWKKKKNITSDSDSQEASSDERKKDGFSFIQKSQFKPNTDRQNEYGQKKMLCFLAKKS